MLLQSTDPERLSNKESSMGDGLISMGTGTRIDFMGRLGEARDGSRGSSGRGRWGKGRE